MNNLKFTPEEASQALRQILTSYQKFQNGGSIPKYGWGGDLWRWLTGRNKVGDKAKALRDRDMNRGLIQSYQNWGNKRLSKAGQAWANKMDSSRFNPPTAQVIADSDEPVKTINLPNVTVYGKRPMYPIGPRVIPNSNRRIVRSNRRQASQDPEMIARIGFLPNSEAVRPNFGQYISEEVPATSYSNVQMQAPFNHYAMNDDTYEEPEDNLTDDQIYKAVSDYYNGYGY